MMEDDPTVPSVPESATAGEGAREDTAERPKKARRSFLTQNACTRCRQKKSKCNGRRPVCGRCEKNGADCIYDVAQEGITRMQNLQQLLEKKNEDHGRLLTLFNAFQRGSDDLATNLLARLRLGEDIQSLVSDVEISQASSMGDPPISPDTQDSKYVRSWPPSPLDQGSWTSWSTRCSPPTGSMSQSSESRPGNAGPSVSFVDPTKNPHASLDGQVDGYSKGSLQSGNLYEQDTQSSHFGSQWQGYMHDGETNPTSSSMELSEASYLDDSKQTSSAFEHGRKLAIPRRSARDETDDKSK